MNIAEIANFIELAGQATTAIAPSLAKVTDPNATVADKVAAVQKDVQIGHAVAVASGATTSTFDEIWGPLSQFLPLIIPFL